MTADQARHLAQGDRVAREDERTHEVVAGEVGWRTDNGISITWDGAERPEFCRFADAAGIARF